MRHALIEPNNRIAQVSDSEFPVAPPLQWVQCDDDVTTEWTYDGTFHVPVPPAPAELNAPIYAELDALDKKLIRPLAENELERVAEIVAQKQALRARLVI